MSKVKTVLSSVVAFTLGAAVCMGVCTSGFRDWSGVKKTFHKVEEVYNGFLATATNGHGISLAVASAAEAQSSYTITATVAGEGVFDDTLTWTAAFTESNAWSTGKTATDYVTLTVAEDTQSVTVVNKAPFGAPIAIKATSVDNTTVSATCQLDYVKRIESLENFSIEAEDASCTFQRGDIRFGWDLTVNGELRYGVGTLAPTVTFGVEAQILDGAVWDGLYDDYGISVAWQDPLSLVSEEYTTFTPNDTGIAIADNMFLSFSEVASLQGVPELGSQANANAFYNAMASRLDGERFSFEIGGLVSYGGVEYDSYRFDVGNYTVCTCGVKKVASVNAVSLDKTNVTF